MSKRRKTDRRLTLIRPCGTCGQLVVTSSASPFMRQVPRDGKRQATTYYCCQSCYAASFKHIGWYDGKASERRAERDKNRDRRESNRRYYAEHAEEIKAKKRAYYAERPGLSAQNSRYYKAKKKLLAAESANGGQAS